VPTDLAKKCAFCSHLVAKGYVKHHRKDRDPYNTAASGRQRCRPLRGLNRRFYAFTWGLRPRLYSAARFAGSITGFMRLPGACAPGFILPPASRAQSRVYAFTWGLRPRLYSVTRFAGSIAGFNPFTWSLRPRLYSAARFAGSIGGVMRLPGACAPGFILPPASRAQSGVYAFTWGLRPKAFFAARFAGSAPTSRPRLSVAKPA
jgi:hypothetical protein